MSRQSNNNNIASSHHLVVRVDKVSTPVAVSPRVETGQVLQPALGVVHSHLGPAVESSSQDNCRLQLDTAGVSDVVLLGVSI